MSNLLSIVITALVAYVLIALAMFAFQSRLIFLPNVPSRALGPGPDSIGLDFESVQFTTDDGVKLHGWYVPAEEPRGVVLFFHGNAGNISHRLETIWILNQLTLSTLIFDYRGYGQSEGTTDEEGTYRDGQAGWRYLTEERGIAANDIVIFGRSLGAAIAAHTAKQNAPGAVILESAFTSAPDMAAYLYPWLPARQLARIRYPTDAYVQDIKSPLLVIHSPDDELIPFRQGQEIFALASRPKQFLQIRGSHNDGFLLTGQRYTDGLDAFLTDALSGDRPY